jgi:hypothetical protein
VIKLHSSERCMVIFLPTHNQAEESAASPLESDQLVTHEFDQVKRCLLFAVYKDN